MVDYKKMFQLVGQACGFWFKSCRLVSDRMTWMNSPSSSVFFLLEWMVCTFGVKVYSVKRPFLLYIHAFVPLLVQRISMYIDVVVLLSPFIQCYGSSMTLWS